MADSAKQELPVGINENLMKRPGQSIVIRKSQLEIEDFEQNVKKLVEVICKNLVNHPDHLQVTIERGERTTVLRIFPHAADIGQVLGKKGGNIAAVRHLVECVSAKYRLRAVIASVDDDHSKLSSAA